MTKLSAIFFLCLTLFGQMFPFPGPGGSAALPNLLIANGHARVIQSLSVGGNHQLMSRSAQVATDNITKLKVALQNFWVNGGVEAGNGGSTTVTASIEYPAGTFTQLKFSGSSSGTIPSGSLLFSDYATVTIPSGATFWVREFDNNASGILLNSWQVSGEALNAAASGLSDQTLGGTITNIGSYSHPPLAIVGPTSKAAVCIVGDSLGFGYNDTDTLLNGDIGLVAKSFPTTLAFANLSGNGLKASNYLANTTARQLKGKKGIWTT